MWPGGARRAKSPRAIAIWHVSGESSNLPRSGGRFRRCCRVCVCWPVSAGKRERVISPGEEKKYLAAAPPLLKDVATLLFDLGLRPEECFRLNRDNFRGDVLEIHTGKGRGSRRRIPIEPRSIEILQRRLADGAQWVFPAPTKTGHIDGSSIKKQHAAALKASGVLPFVLYSIRHTVITRWSTKVDGFVLHHVAGHVSMETTARYAFASPEASLRGILHAPLGDARSLAYRLCHLLGSKISSLFCYILEPPAGIEPATC